MDALWASQSQHIQSWMYHPCFQICSSCISVSFAARAICHSSRALGLRTHRTHAAIAASASRDRQTSASLSTHADTASSPSHNQRVPLTVLSPTEAEWHHRIFFYMVSQATTAIQSGLVPCLFPSLFFMQSPVWWREALSHLALCLPVGFSGRHLQETRKQEASDGRILQGLPQVGCIPLLKDTALVNTLLNSRNCSFLT